MARIEKQASLEKQIQDVKPRKPWFACLMIFFAVFLIGAGFLAWTVASTGLVSIPVFTRFAYTQPVPVREVAPGVPVETVLREQIATSLIQRFVKVAAYYPRQTKRLK